MSVSIHTAEDVSLRAIAEDGAGMASPVSLRDVATERGIERSFAGRELITSQTYDDIVSLVVDDDFDWENWLKDYDTTAAKLRPSDADDVRQILAWAADGYRRVRAVGANHSHSQAARPDDDGNFLQLSWYDSGDESLAGVIGQLPERPRRDDLTEASNFGPGHDPATEMDDLHAVRVGAGEMIKRLNRKLLFEQDLGVLNMGSYDAQTVAGAVNTSTHGTGVGLGTFGDVVLSVEMGVVMPSPVENDVAIVRQFRIEPEDGITDAPAFMDRVGEHGMAMIQDDDVFHAAVVGYGAMGVASSYTLLVRDQYFLEEHSKRWPSPKPPSETDGWGLIKQDGVLKDRLTDDSIRHFNFLLNVPGTFGSPSTDQPSCLLRKRYHRPWDEDVLYPGFGAPERRSFGDFGKKLRRWTSGSGVDPKDPNPALASTIRNNYFKPLQNKEPFVAPTDNVFKTVEKTNTTASYNALRRTPDGHFPNPERPPTKPPDPAMTTEVAIPVEHVEDAIDALIDEVGNVQDNDDFHFMAPLGVRFTAPSEHMLTPEYRNPEDSNDGSDWPAGFAMLELPFTVGTVDPHRNSVGTAVVNALPGGGVILAATRVANIMPDRYISQSQMVAYSKDALRPIEQRLRQEFDGRPHMGKFHTMERADLEAAYPRFDTWYDVYSQFNAFGTFNNGFTDDLGISMDPGPPED